MHLQLISTIVNAVQLAVVVFTAASALLQLRHNRAASEMKALFAAQDDFRRPEVAAALRYVQEELPHKLEDPAYRAQLADLGFVDPVRHPEMELLNWFSGVGALVQHGAVGEALFLELFARLTAHYWTLLEPVVALLRRSRGDGQYLSFEYLAVRSRAWIAREAAARGPRARGFERIAIRDRYLEGDRAREVPRAAR